MSETKIWTIEEVQILLSLQSSFRYYEFKNQFGISIDDVTGCDNLFCVCDQRVQVYADAQAKDLQEFVNFLNQNKPEYQKLIEENKVFAHYIKNHNLTDEQILKLSQND